MLRLRVSMAIWDFLYYFLSDFLPDIIQQDNFSIFMLRELYLFFSTIIDGLVLMTPFLRDAYVI